MHMQCVGEASGAARTPSFLVWGLSHCRSSLILTVRTTYVLNSKGGSGYGYLGGCGSELGSSRPAAGGERGEWVGRTPGQGYLGGCGSELGSSRPAAGGERGGLVGRNQLQAAAALLCRC